MVWPAPRIWSTHGETNDSNLSANTSHAADDRQLRQLHRLTHLAVPTGPVSFEERHPPDPLGEYLRATMRGGASDDGMLARFGLLVWPETGDKRKNVDRIPDGPAKQAAFQVFDELDALDALARGTTQESEDAPPFLRFDPEALEAFTDWRCSLEAGLPTGAALGGVSREPRPALLWRGTGRRGGHGPADSRADCKGEFAAGRLREPGRMAPG